MYIYIYRNSEINREEIYSGKTIIYKCVVPYHSLVRFIHMLYEKKNIYVYAHKCISILQDSSHHTIYVHR